MKKAFSFLMWILVMLILLLAFIGGRLFFPIAYIFKDIPLFRNKILWVFFGDDDPLYGAEYWRKAKGITKNNFWVAYRWNGLRNPMWNLHLLMKPIEGEEVILQQKGWLAQNGNYVPLNKVAVLQYEDENGDWVGNSGDIVSLKYSILGKTFIWFKIQDRFYWRFSLANRYLKLFWVEVQLGTGYRHTFRLKIKH